MEPIIIALICLGVAILVCLLAVLILTNKNKKHKKIETFDQEALDKLLVSLGGKDNILTIENNSQRLAITVKDLKKVLLNELNNLGAQGVFVSGNKIKMLVTKNVEPLLELFKERNHD